jgi:hypothetical protein
LTSGEGGKSKWFLYGERRERGKTKEALNDGSTYWHQGRDLVLSVASVFLSPLLFFLAA